MSPRLRDVPAKRELRPRDYWQMRLATRRRRSDALLAAWRAAWDADPYTEAEVRALALDRILGSGRRERLAGADAESVRAAVRTGYWSFGHYGFHVEARGRTWTASNGPRTVELELTIRDVVGELRIFRQDALFDPP